MRIINPKASDKDSFKYSIIALLHYYDINCHPERISKLDSYKNNYNFTHHTPKEFEIDNPNISLTVYSENDNIMYASVNKSNEKACVIKINNYGYNAIKPPTPKIIKLKNMLSQFTHEELSHKLKEIILKKVHGN